MKRLLVACALLVLTSTAHAMPRELADKANEIVRDCGSKIISTFRRNAVVRGTRRASLHASNRAVDLRGNPKCIYAKLQGWPGGYTTDYRIGHVHVSYAPGGREWGLRFRHGRHGGAGRRSRSADANGNIITRRSTRPHK